MKPSISKFILTSNICRACFRSKTSEGVKRKGIEKGIQQGKVYGVIEAYRDQGMPEAEILKQIRQKFSLTEEKAKEYMAR